MSVDIATRLRSGRSGFDSCHKEIVSCPKRPDPTQPSIRWSPETLSSKVKRSKREFDQPSLFSAEGENERSRNNYSCCLCAFTVCTEQFALALRCVGVFRMTGTTNRLNLCLGFVLETLSAACDVETQSLNYGGKIIYQRVLVENLKCGVQYMCSQTVGCSVWYAQNLLKPIIGVFHLR